MSIFILITPQANMSIRTERLGSVIQKDLGSIIQKNYQHDSIITITKVEVTDDLLIAKVHVSIMAPGRDKNEVFTYLKGHGVEIRKKLAQKIKNQVRRIPEIYFFLDNSAEYAEKMDRLFNKIQTEREQRKNG